MKKLNQKKIRWIVREIDKSELSRYQIAKMQDITPVHAWRIYNKYKGEKHPRLQPCGRKPQSLVESEVKLVLDAHEDTGLGAVNIEKVLAERAIHIPHNRIHRILLSKGLAQIQPKKSNRRKWIRYERKHSNSLWHVDWTEMNELQYIFYEDDASRLVTGYGEFVDATTENALKIFDSAIKAWGTPRQLMSDHGCQFCSMEEREFRFSKHLKDEGVEHIMARVKHPQSNGKLERLILTMKQLIVRRGGLDAAVIFYNERRPHMSLENGHLRTPLQAFHDKMRC